jgi:lysophospholipase L1-like esterase
MNRMLKRLSVKRGTTTLSDRTPVVKAALSPQGKLRRIAIKVATTVVSTVVVISILWGADLYLHHKHGINLWGYRGAAVGQKQPGEKRIVVLGGSTAWGFGLNVGQDFPGQLQRRFAERSRTEGGASIQILNLASNSEGAYSFRYTLQDYDYLDYDVVLLYSGYNDLSQQNFYNFRHRSPIFIWTGYLPLLPTLAVDRISAWRRQRGKNEAIVFAPPGPSDSETSKQTSKSLQKELGPLTDSSQFATKTSDGTCPAQWQFYCQQIYDVTDSALRHGKRVLVVTEPYISDKHVEQQRALEAMLKQRFEGQAHLRYLNLGPAIDLKDKSLCWDGMHLTEEGNRRIAEALIQPVLEILQR